MHEQIVQFTGCYIFQNRSGFKQIYTIRFTKLILLWDLLANIFFNECPIPGLVLRYNPERILIETRQIILFNTALIETSKRFIWSFVF